MGWSQSSDSHCGRCLGSESALEGSVDTAQVAKSRSRRQWPMSAHFAVRGRARKPHRNRAAKRALLNARRMQATSRCARLANPRTRALRLGVIMNAGAPSEAACERALFLHTTCALTHSLHTPAAPYKKGPLADRRQVDLSPVHPPVPGSERVRVLTWNVLAQARVRPPQRASPAAEPGPARGPAVPPVRALLSRCVCVGTSAGRLARATHGGTGASPAGVHALQLVRVVPSARPQVRAQPLPRRCGQPVRGPPPRPRLAA